MNAFLGNVRNRVLLNPNLGTGTVNGMIAEHLVTVHIQWSKKTKEKVSAVT